ncbi:MAG: group II intron reverse transcriptase/maturase, partial [Ignavibacteria bacterium]|nr:group II intron reverse transcriptase/maturase [Ignavibacteria bacterium]
IREIYKYLNWGCTEIYDVDLEQYFDTVDHWKLMKLIARRVVDKQILHVIDQWLSCGYVEDGRHWQSKKGTPQGGVISPLLANIYLNPVDQAFERSKLAAIKRGSIHLVRYADDMVILAQRNLKEGVDLLHKYTEGLGLRLNQEKTREVHMIEGASVDFLGFRFLYTRNRKTHTRLVLVYPSPKSQKRCREKLRTMVHHSIPLRLKDQIVKANRFLRGWVGYFRVGNAAATFRDINQFVNKRVRRVLQRRRGKCGFGWSCVSSQYIYGHLGLFYNYHVQRL